MQVSFVLVKECCDNSVQRRRLCRLSSFLFIQWSYENVFVESRVEWVVIREPCRFDQLHPQNVISCYSRVPLFSFFGGGVFSLH